MTKPLLIEIGVEELPAIPLLKIVKNIESSWKKILGEYNLQSDFEFLYTPRRLVILSNAMPVKQADAVVELVGPPVDVAIKDGKPTPAGAGFAKKCGVEFDELDRSEKNGREVLYFKQEQVGEPTAKLLPEMISKWISSMSFGKMMRWGDRGDEFIRPIRWLQVRLGDDSVDMELFGVSSEKSTRVHRMIENDNIEISNIDEYEHNLASGSVILRPKDREAKILKEFEELESKHGITIERDRGLLAEVVAITENPKALLGEFDETFLELPSEVIITSMKEHQRYFPVFKDGEILNKFVVVSNAYTDDYTKVVEGNERVLKPRLADALFFYHNDLKAGLSTDGLEKVQFIDGLGTLSDKVERERDIAMKLLDIYIDRLMAQTGKSREELEAIMQKAITLAKADLMSEMVYEFTELQGLMGHYYAKALGEDEIVYDAIAQQYMPVGDGAELPEGIFATIVSMSIKLDTLLGLFSVGKIPTGSKDPFALRRAVNGISRMVSSNDLEFDITQIIEMLKGSYESFDESQLEEFMIERLSKSLDANPSVITAVLSTGERDVSKITQKVSALDEIVKNESFKELSSTFKRVANISKDQDMSREFSVDESLFVEDAEKSLYAEYGKVSKKQYESYADELNALFGLRPYLDSYFDNVMVNADDEKLKENRLSQISTIYKKFLDIADIKEVTL